MYKRLLSLWAFVLLNIFIIRAQIGVGEWRDHLPFFYSTVVTESPSKVYLASESGVFSYSKVGKNIEKLTKVNILSDVGVSHIAYSEENEVLVVGYKNGNLDLVFDNETYNISDIKRESLSGSKTINHILFINENAYLSCGFGIVVVNLARREIKNTYYIGSFGSQVNVYQMAFDNNYLYAATSQGIYIADYTNSNLIDYSNWNLITNIPDYNAGFNGIYVKNGSILANKYNPTFHDELYGYLNGTWSIVNNVYSEIRKIRETVNGVHIVTNRNVLLFDSNFNLQDSISRQDIPSLNPYDVSLSNNTFWIADRGSGLIKYDGVNYEGVAPNAPYLPYAFSIDTDQDKVVVTGGRLTQSWGNSFFNGAVFVFENERWSSMINYEAADYVSVKVDPYNQDHFYTGSWGGGVIEYRNNKVVETYKDNNSTLQSIFPGEDYYRIGGLVFDNDNNLWVTNSSVGSPVSVKTPAGNWINLSFDEKISNMLVGDIMVTQTNNYWLILPKGNGLFVFDHNNTIGDENDDLSKKLSLIDVNKNVISNNVYSLAEDTEGNIWVGTDQGIVVYYYPDNVFDDTAFFAQRIVLTIGDVTEHLLGSQTITSIAVDGANRKWLGTRSTGVYLVSDDGTEEINHFTKDNSPLLSNNIYDIGINHETGEVFFATDEGLISYRGSATKGSDEFRDVYVYPNPVRENYVGNITIRGLVSDVNVKITSISGNIVYETKAEGGQATWDGKNFSGQRVSTGVYLVFCTNDDGSKTYITKLLFIK